jgi:hypothetical protein
MSDTSSFRPDDLVLIVRPNQSQPAVASGLTTWQQAASGGWAMDASKGARVRVLLAVHNRLVVGAWRVVSVTHRAEVPEGKSRAVSRSTFETVADDRLRFLIGSESPKEPRRNPQTAMQLRDLPGSEVLLEGVEPATHGLVRLGAFSLAVGSDGRAVVQMPAGTELTVRTST